MRRRNVGAKEDEQGDVKTDKVEKKSEENKKAAEGSKKSRKMFDHLTFSDWAILLFGTCCFVLAIMVYIASSSTTEFKPTLSKKAKSSKNKKDDVVYGSHGQVLPKEATTGATSNVVEGMDPYVDPPKDSQLFTKEELAKHTEALGKSLWLAVVGEIYDVSEGSFYKSGGGYDFFVGVDGTKGFNTGIPEPDMEKIDEGSARYELAGVIDWANFYRNNADYKYVGKLIGHYWTEEGVSTPARDHIVEQYWEYKADSEKDKELSKKYPYCRMKNWNKPEMDTMFWCDKGRIEMLQRVGINPTSTLVPRKIFGNAAQTLRCGCVEIDVAEKDTETFQEYEGCPKTNQTCFQKKAPAVTSEP